MRTKSGPHSEPEKFSDKEYLESVNRSLRKKGAYLVVVNKEGCFYAGAAVTADFVNELTLYDYGNNDNVGHFIEGDNKVYVNAVEVEFNDNSQAMAYVIIDVQDVLPQLKRLAVDAIIAIILILVITSALFTAWIYKETVSPIKKLRLATHNIKNGNLDFEIEVTGKDEIAELCHDFDRMRIQLKENAEEKQEADLESKELISNISHDLKTPVTAIKGYVEGIMDGVADTDEKMDRYIRTIYTKACDMEKLINELTFYSKIDTNQIPYNFTEISVSDYFNDCIDEIGMDLEARGMEFKYSNDVDADTRIKADPEQLKRVIGNIVSNSVKYMGSDHGIIALSVREDEDNVYIEIGDNGIGISKKDMPYIFDRFYRADASRTSPQSGSGIGLAIVKKIITDHEGSISATSEPGEGTVMHIILKKYKEGPTDER